jgi:hypothetical protein
MAMKTIVLAFPPLILPSVAHATCEPIRFAPGKSSVNIEGTVPPNGQGICYTIATAKGQTAQVKLTRANSNTAFTIPDVVDNRDDYTFKTEARTYQIDIYQIFRTATQPARFTLSVGVR